MMDDDEDVTRIIAEMISDYREECLNAMQSRIVNECDEIVESGYDPAKGSGRGPLWADGD